MSATEFETELATELLAQVVSPVAGPVAGVGSLCTRGRNRSTDR
jgi:hypothetical protein